MPWMVVRAILFACRRDSHYFYCKLKPEEEERGVMIVSDEQKVSAVAINNPEVRNVDMKMLIGEKEGWADHVMRVFELGPDGHTPRHRHPWPHINYILEGAGILFMDGREHPVQSGGYAYVPAGVEHQFKNAGRSGFRFICIVPKEGHK